MKILLLSDSHFAQTINDPELKEVLAKQLPLADKLDRMIKQEDLSTYDFVVVCGDLVHEGTAQDYQLLEQLLREKLDPLQIYFVLGNHDRKNQFYQGILSKNLAGNYDYSFVYKDIHFIILDSAKAHTHSGELDPDQLAWLAEEFKQNDFPKVIFQHHPIFGSDYFENFVFLEPHPTMEVLKQAQILAVFTGHTHSPAVHVYQGIRQYTTYALSFGLEKLADKSQAFTNTCGYSIIEIDGQLINFAPRMITPDYDIYKQTNPQEMQALNKSYEQE